ncbi:glycosyl hydrolase family 61-domain-containing protein [Clohesyomyces aquaticus]|uniref:lytic cellulose monooxygenase (C4-dehydrogenating) n=1 Tax=Clohesyomyces aquaticus TaxID=1231657 RepID=A0A1Y1ZDW3_9PLEO|nr:glycosyl hydrolase family 61-domain-containing protein [Clohesyomyces aquaticus]
MTCLLFLAALTAVASLTEAHFTFVRVKHNNEWKNPLQYIRNKTSPYDEQAYYLSNFLGRYYNWPTYSIDRPESIRCGRDNMAHASSTEVLTVHAGDELEIAQQRSEPAEWKPDQFENCPDGKGTCYHEDGWYQDFNHPGPLLVHLSRVPSGQNITTYDGTGDWVKIHTVGLTSTPTSPVLWKLYTRDPPHMTFKIPATVPAGQYLMRMDVIWSGFLNAGQKPGDDGTLAQMYPSCAQLNIINNSTTPTTFPTGVKIPEIFMPGMPGMETTRDMYSQTSLDPNYTYPGGDLWDGEKFIVDKPVSEL